MRDELRFEWDASKARTNLLKHGISFEEAATVFYDDLARIEDDADHSMGEERELIFGRSAEARFLLVSFNERGNSIRIISARKATKHERRRYEKDTL